MAATTLTQQEERTETSPEPLGASDHSKIAAATVVEHLTPTLHEAIEKEVQQGIQPLKQEVLEHTKRISDIENRISVIEDEQPSLMAASQKLENCQALVDKIEDLENR